MKKLFSAMLLSLIALFALSFDVGQNTELQTADVGIYQGDFCQADAPVLLEGSVAKADYNFTNGILCMTINAESPKATHKMTQGYTFKISGVEVRCSLDSCVNYKTSYKPEGNKEVCIRGDGENLNT